MKVMFSLAKACGIILALLLCVAVRPCHAQDLTPRAYVITPVHTNAVILTYSFREGSVLFDPTLPITNSTGKLNVTMFSVYHTLSFFGRSANITAILPYTVGTFQGDVNGKPGSIYRSGLLDSIFRFSVNLKGGPAMTVKEFSTWRQKTIVGVSVRVEAPTGQYDPTKLVNPGTNRWAFKPEIGLSRRVGKWIFDGYAGVWFFTANPEFFSHNAVSPGVNTLGQAPIGSLETHVSYDFKPRLWASFDWNYWYGGRRTLNGKVTSDSLQANSRIGATASVPLNKRQSLKFSYSYGDVVRVGGNYHAVAIAWQYGWFGRPN
jgi:hypothetical protein